MAHPFRRGIKLSQILLAGLAGGALCVAGIPGARASGTVVSSIYGAYDAECGSNIDCTFGTGYAVTTSGGTEYDNPSLFIVNNTANPFTGGTITLTGYQGLVNGQTATITLPTIAANSVYDLIWGSALPVTGDATLFSYDYDDQFGNALAGNPLCVQPYPFCAQPGNFDVSFAATTNGGPISSIFSPDNTQGGGNQAGTFVGFEGLDPTGLSETVYDDHTGSQPGVLAYIYTGTGGTQGGGGTTSVPEPATLALLGAGVLGLGLTRRRGGFGSQVG